jgi:hypothetical protein
VTATTSEVSRHTSAVRNAWRRVVSLPVTITVSSIPTRVGDTAVTWSAAAVTARITVFHPTPNWRRIVSIATLASLSATAALAAARDHTASGAIETVRSTKVPQPSTQMSSLGRSVGSDTSSIEAVRVLTKHPRPGHPLPRGRPGKGAVEMPPPPSCPRDPRPRSIGFDLSGEELADRVLR